MLVIVHLKSNTYTIYKWLFRAYKRQDREEKIFNFIKNRPLLISIERTTKSAQLSQLVTKTSLFSSKLVR